jgi:DHA1 family bicyclomycin/chloramphenicol resistance-like MFS transporter
VSIIETFSSETAEPAAERKLTAGLLVLLAGLAAIGALSTNIILPSFPSIGVALNVPARDLGLTLSSFFIAFAIGQLFVGPLSDRYGRREDLLRQRLIADSARQDESPDHGRQSDDGFVAPLFAG